MMTAPGPSMFVAVCSGYSPTEDEPDLADDPERWLDAWTIHRDRLLAEWIRRYPGTRPLAWYEHDAAQHPAPLEEEDDAQHLARIGLFSEAECEAMWTNLISKAVFNVGREPSRGRTRVPSGFVAYTDADNWVSENPPSTATADDLAVVSAIPQEAWDAWEPA